MKLLLQTLLILATTVKTVVLLLTGCKIKTVFSKAVQKCFLLGYLI